MSATISADLGSLKAPGTGSMKPNSRLSTQHLQRFVDAKKKIATVFGDLHQYVDGVSVFLAGVEKDFVQPSHVDEATRFRDSVLTIREMLERDHMKVVFFGRTSNGKSTVINAMLHSKVLPQGMGHTTRCFVQVEGSNSDKKFILEGGSPEKKNIESLDEVAHALSGRTLGEDALVKVLWPKNDSRLLQNEVVFLDSPGVDLSPEFDSWIDKHCLDADVFVLVCNAEATLTQAEKNFFLRVNSKLSKPNIFILNNRWDASAAEPESMEQVREQHIERFTEFLVKELKIATSEDIKKRVFFVSAREVLHQRLKNKGVATPTTFLADGYLPRTMEFENFEEQFETCISKSAIRTKFEAHIRKAKDIVSSLHETLDGLYKLSQEERSIKSESHKTKLDELKKSQESIRRFIRKSQEQIQRLSEEVQLRVGSDYNEEIRRLGFIIETYDKQPFLDEPASLELYKKNLVNYIDQVVSNDLTVRFTGGLHERIMKTEQNIIDGISSNVPQDKSDRIKNVVSYREPFKFSIAVHCPSLVEDFKEDLEFRFSLGLTQLIRRFIQLRNGYAGGEAGRLPFGNRMIEGGGDPPPPPEYGQEDVLMKSLILSSASYVANGGIGLMIVGGIVYRSVGWRVIAVLGACYGGLYLYERLSWSARKKEQQFRNQLTSHLGHRMKQLSHNVTMNCENQVTREVQEVLTRLQGISVDIHQEMKGEVDKVDKEIKELEGISKELGQTKGKATFLGAELENYETKFLQSESPR